MIRTTFWTRHSQEERPDDVEGAERIHAQHPAAAENDHEMEALNRKPDDDENYETDDSG